MSEGKDKDTRFETPSSEFNIRIIPTREQERIKNGSQHRLLHKSVITHTHNYNPITTLLLFLYMPNSVTMSQTLSCRTLHPHQVSMDSTGLFHVNSPSHSFLLCSPTLFTHNSSNTNPITFTTRFAKKSHAFPKIMASTASTAKPIAYGFKTLMETFTVDVHRAENRPLNVPLIAPFTIASSRLDKVENVAIRVELSNGAVGWGEAAILPFVTAEDQPMAMAKASEACAFLLKCPALTLGSLLREIGGILPGHEFASVSEN